MRKKNSSFGQNETVCRPLSFVRGVDLDSFWSARVDICTPWQPDGPQLPSVVHWSSPYRNIMCWMHDTPLIIYADVESRKKNFLNCTLLFFAADQNIRLYDTRRGRFHLQRTVKARDVGWSVLDVCFTPDAQHVLYSSWSGYSKATWPPVRLLVCWGQPVNTVYKRVKAGFLLVWLIMLQSRS